MASNTEDIGTRVARGKAQEVDILATLNEHTDLYWEAATEGEDMFRKIDAWVCGSEDRGCMRSVQIKTRETGSDLGLAMVRPYENVYMLKHDLDCGTVPWDRDMQGDVDVLVVRVPYMGLVMVDATKVKAAAMALLEDFANEVEPFTGTCYGHGTQGIELRITTDKGRGYSEGQRKIICYMTPRFLVKLGGKVIQGR